MSGCEPAAPTPRASPAEPGQVTQTRMADPGSLRILITTIDLWPPSGTVMYVRDLALELHHRGHRPAVFGPTAGAVADELRSMEIPVTAHPDRLPWAPDVLHAHHHAPTLLALRAWPGVPAIHLCHDHTAADDRTPLDPRIVRHLGVSRVCVERLLREGAPRDRTALLPNFVDTGRFRPRGPLPARPRRALVFSNYARADTHLAAVTEACREAGLDLDVVGLGVGNVVFRPELLLGDYDIVFAKGRAAIEAMAVGAAVVLCDFAGVGPMVSARAFDDLRPLNFGFAALRAPLRREPLLREIARYDPVDAAAVRDRIRSEASLSAAVDRLVEVYREAVEAVEAVAEAGSPDLRGDRPRPVGAVPRAWFLRLLWAWRSLSPGLRRRIGRLPGLDSVRRATRHFFGEAG